MQYTYPWKPTNEPSEDLAFKDWPPMSIFTRASRVQIPTLQLLSGALTHDLGIKYHALPKLGRWVQILTSFNLDLPKQQKLMGHYAAGLSRQVPELISK